MARQPKMRMKTLLLTLPFGALLATSAEARDISMRFDIYAGGVHAASGVYWATVERDKYRVEARTQTLGMLDKMFQWRSQTKASGRIVDGELTPQSAYHMGQNRRGKREIDIAFRPGQSTLATIKGTGKYDDDAKGPLPLAGAPLDALTGLTKAILAPRSAANPCGPEMDVFTGRRRNVVSFKALGPDLLKPTQYAAYNGPATKCQMFYERKVAFQEDLGKPQGEKKPRPDVYVWFAPSKAQDVAIPVRIETHSRYGHAVVHLMSLKVDDDIKLAHKAR